MNSCARYDWSKLNEIEIYLGAVFLLPMRIVSLAIFMALIYAICGPLYHFYGSKPPFLKFRQRQQL